MNFASLIGYGQKMSYCLLMVIILTGCIRENPDDNDEGANLSIGDPIPELNLLLSDNSRISEEHLKNKVSVILLFTTECGDCQKQLPIFDRLYQRYKENEEVVIFGISRNNPEDVVSGYWIKNGLTIPYSAQADRNIYNLFATSTVPRIYLNDRQGIIREMFTDKPLATFDQLSRTVEELLAEE